MIRISPVRLRTWFPPGDPVAAAVARLCILREDLLLELNGIVGVSFEKLDANTREFRKLYFWRNSLRTLAEIRDSLNKINSEMDFRAALASEGTEVERAFESLKKELNKASQGHLGKLRNTVAAHLDAELLRQALDHMDHDREGLMEVGETTGTWHYKFGGELILAMLLKGVPRNEQQDRFEDMLGASARLSRAVTAIDDVFTCYARNRRLR